MVENGQKNYLGLQTGIRSCMDPCEPKSGRNRQNKCRRFILAYFWHFELEFIGGAAKNGPKNYLGVGRFSIEFVGGHSRFRDPSSSIIGKNIFRKKVPHARFREKNYLRKWDRASTRQTAEARGNGRWFLAKPRVFPRKWMEIKQL